MDCGHPPRIVWMLWLQGWDAAPDVARAARDSWIRHNPGWEVRALDRGGLAGVLPAGILARIFAVPKEPEALSDQIRLELLHRYGGVWADATTLCAAPLDSWLPAAMPAGFFAFARPGPDRLLASWFLAAEKGSHVVARWRAAAWRYWQDRTRRDHYFWLHRIFAELHEQDAGVRALWDPDAAPSAQHPFHFGPESPALKAPAPPGIAAVLADPPVPVFKLTHKFAAPPGPGSLFRRLLDFAAGEGAAEAAPPRARPQVLVGWYGSFAGHGTIGDLRSLEAVVSHLVGRGFAVRHASALPLDIPGAARVAWAEVPPGTADAVLFVCGPILKHHPQTRAFFARFAGRPLAGIGVSLMPEGHENHHDPFVRVFARQGGGETHGDVAITAPQPAHAAASRPQGPPVVGVSLRGPQAEYGTALCLSDRTGELVAALTDVLVRHAGAEVLEIENHLARSGLDPDGIEDLYGRCDLVLTSRFHGAICALRQGVPVVAIDQIRGGAKVWPLLEELELPGLFLADRASPLEVIAAGLAALTGDPAARLARSARKAIGEGNRTLNSLDAWLCDLAADPAG